MADEPTWHNVIGLPNGKASTTPGHYGCSGMTPPLIDKSAYMLNQPDIFHRLYAPPNLIPRRKQEEVANPAIMRQPQLVMDTASLTIKLLGKGLLVLAPRFAPNPNDGLPEDFRLDRALGTRTNGLATPGKCKTFLLFKRTIAGYSRLWGLPYLPRRGFPGYETTLYDFRCDDQCKKQYMCFACLVGIQKDGDGDGDGGRMYFEWER